MKPPLTRLFGYYGAKYGAAKHYPPPLYKTIVEPFAGSAGYSLHYYDRKVVLIELNPIVAALWRFLIRASYDDIMSIPLLEIGESTDDLKTSQEAKTLVGFHLQGNISSPAKKFSGWAENIVREKGMLSKDFWGSECREKIAAQIHFIDHWEVIEGSYEFVAPEIEATWFVDPPYNNQAGENYRFKDVDFEHLGSWCKERSGQVIVCENEGADWLPFRPFRSMGRNAAKEVIWAQLNRKKRAR